MESTARPTRMNVDLQHYKQAWIDYCRSRNTTPSEAFRQVVAKLTAGAPLEDTPALNDEAGGEPKVRKEIRLSQQEFELAEAIAVREGFSVPRWIVALVRARLNGSAQLGQRELAEFARSNLQLMAIGRNLKQVAKEINSGSDRLNEVLPEQIEVLQATLMDHTRVVSQVLASNLKRWVRP